MYGCRTPPDVVLGIGGCKDSRPEVDFTCTPRSPTGRTQRIRDDHSMVASSSPVITSPSPLTSSTPEHTTGKSPRNASRHVEFLLNESAISPPCIDVTNGDGHIHRPTDLDVGQKPTNWNERRRPTKSMIMIGEDDVDELFQPVSINGDSFALLQTPTKYSNSFIDRCNFSC